MVSKSIITLEPFVRRRCSVMEKISFSFVIQKLCNKLMLTSQNTHVTDDNILPSELSRCCLHIRNDIWLVKKQAPLETMQIYLEIWFSDTMMDSVSCTLSMILMTDRVRRCRLAWWSTRDNADCSLYRRANCLTAVKGRH